MFIIVAMIYTSIVPLETNSCLLVTRWALHCLFRLNLLGEEIKIGAVANGRYVVVLSAARPY